MTEDKILRGLREACRQGRPIDGGDARALEHELSEAEARIEALERALENTRAHVTGLSEMGDAQESLIEKLEAERNSVMEGQDALKAQTIRIRRALTDVVEDGVDTEAIARRVRCERDESISALNGIFVSHAAELTERHWNADTCEPEPCDCDGCREARRVMADAKKWRGPSRFDPERGNGRIRDGK